MRRSKSLLLALTVLLCFAIGFGIGAFPDRWQKLRGRPSERLSLLISDSQLFPEQFILDFEKATGIPVEVKVLESYHLFRTEAQNSDLLFAPLSWLGSYPEILKTLPAQESFHHLLSTDFQTLRLELSSFVPVLWTTQAREGQTHLLIWGFATPNPGKSGIQEFLNFFLTSDRRQKQWAQFTKLNLTLERSNQIKDFPDEQRARKIRDVSLPNLVIDQKTDSH